MSRTKKPLSERIAQAEAMAAKWLADANEYAEKGNSRKAEQCEARCQFWLDRANNLRGWGEEKHAAELCKSLGQCIH